MDLDEFLVTVLQLYTLLKTVCLEIMLRFLVPWIMYV